MLTQISQIPHLHHRQRAPRGSRPSSPATCPVSRERPCPRPQPAEIIGRASQPSFSNRTVPLTRARRTYESHLLHSLSPTASFRFPRAFRERSKIFHLGNLSHIPFVGYLSHMMALSRMFSGAFQRPSERVTSVGVPVFQVASLVPSFLVALLARSCLALLAVSMRILEVISCICYIWLCR